jgi:hypothetical protein
MKIRAIEEIKEFLEARNSWELIQIIAMLFFLLGLTAGFLAGECQATTKIGEQLQNHVINEGDGINPQDYFSIDDIYLYYLIKTNITIEDYRNVIS